MAGRVIRGFVSWWFGELASLVPVRVRRLFNRKVDTVVVQLEGSEVVIGRRSGDRFTEIARVDTAGLGSEEERKAIARLVRKFSLRRLNVAVRIPAEQTLQKTVRLPLAAEENLRQVLGFELERHTPFSRDEVYFDFSVSKRDAAAQQIEIDLTVAPREVVDEAIERAAGWGLEADVVDVASGKPGAGADVNLLAERQLGERPSSSNALNVTLAVAAVALSVTAVYIPLARYERDAAALQRMVAEARSQAETAVRLREEIDGLVGNRRFLIDRKRQTPAITAILDELTRLIPDDTWLFRLQLKADSVALAGYSPAASALLGALEASPILQKTRFGSPVTQDPRIGLDRFNLSAELVREDQG